MKKSRVYLYCLIFCLCFSASAAPLLDLVNGNSVDLGTFESRLARAAVFEIKNSGDEPLKIFKVRKTCGCFEVDEFPKELEPGKSGKIKISLEAYGLSDKFSKMVFVHSNSDKAPIQILRISGKAVPLCKISPSKGVNVFNLAFKSKSDKERVYTFSLKPTGNKSLVLGQPTELNKKGIKVALEKFPGAKKGYALKVFISPEAEKGRIRLPIEVPVKSPKGWKPVEALLYGKISILGE